MTKINEDTGFIDFNIINLTRYLFDSYDNISDQNLHNEIIKKTQHQSIHNNPIANFFNAIHTYSDMAKAYGNPETNN